MTTRLPVLGASVLGLLAVAGCYRYRYTWGGDPEIHLVFAQNLLAGHALQFNPGEYSSGESSPLYMVLLAAARLILPLAAMPLLMKAIGVLACLAIAREIHLHARALGRSAESGLFFAGYFLAFPFVWFQAWLGMENMAFAAVCAAFVRRLLEGRLQLTTAGRVLGASAGLVLLFSLRPEAVFLGAALALDLLRARRGSLAALLAVCAGGASTALVLGLEALTGAPLYGAGELRALLGRFDSVAIGAGAATVWVSLKPLRIALYLWPFGVAAALDHLRSRRAEQVHPAATERGRVLVVLAALVVAPCLLHVLNVLPNIHSSRYLLYVHASALLAGLHFVTDLRRAPRLTAVFVAAALGFFALEVSARGAAPGAAALAQLQDRPIGTLGDALCRAAGCSAQRPLVVAAQEVQVRLRLDHRFVVRSLDGVVDYRLRDHVKSWGVDHAGYLRARHVDLLLDLPGYNPDPTRFALSDLRRLAPGAAVVRDGIRFERIAAADLRRAGLPETAMLVRVAPATR